MKVAFIVDDLNSFKIKKDSTFAMFEAVAKKGWQQSIIYMQDMFLEDGVAYARAKDIIILQNFSQEKWYDLGEENTLLLSDFDVILMRKDPPFNMMYIYVTYMLDLAQKEGVLIVNNPQSLRNYNEKVAITHFPHLAPTTLISKDYQDLNRFYEKHKDIIAKPLDGMGGISIFRIKDDDKNKNVIFEVLTQNQSEYIMAQTYQKEILQGDKRILIVDGKPVEYLVARIPSDADNRGNLAVGATADVRKLTEKDFEIANEIGEFLKANNIIFAGIDVIGSSLTEINITSPTGIQEIFKDSGINTAELLMDAIEKRLEG